MSMKLILGATTALVLATAGAEACGVKCYEHVVTPAEYATVSERVVVRPARTVARTIPAEFGTEIERVVVRPERVIAHRIPAEVRTVSEQVLVKPAGKVWQVTVDASGREIGCWVNTPAQYATRTRQVVVRPESVEHETIPAVYGERARTVMVRPASVVHETIPAVYGERSHTVMVRPASSSWQPVRRGLSW